MSEFDFLEEQGVSAALLRRRKSFDRNMAFQRKRSIDG